MTSRLGFGDAPMALGAIGAEVERGLLAVAQDAPKVRLVVCERCKRPTPPASIEQGACTGCRDAERSRLERLASRLEQIPPVYRGGSLERPPMICPTPSTDALAWSGHLRAALEWLDGSKRVLSIFGPQTASGKSTLAACTAATWIGRGGSIRWVHAVDLVDDDPAKARAALETIRSAPFVVLDGCGKEFGNGRMDSFDSDKPKAVMLRVFTHIHQSRGQRFVLTFDLPVEVLWKAAYDASLMRRVMNEEFADVITLRRNGELRVTPGGKAE